MAECGGNSDQLWKWESLEFTTPNVEWNMVACNENGPVETTIQSSVEYSESISNEVSIAVEASISAETGFGGAEVKTSVSQSLARQWSRAKSYS